MLQGFVCFTLVEASLLLGEQYSQEKLCVDAGATSLLTFRGVRRFALLTTVHSCGGFHTEKGGVFSGMVCVRTFPFTLKL